jgi:hypothetical protein
MTVEVKNVIDEDPSLLDKTDSARIPLFSFL